MYLSANFANCLYHQYNRLIDFIWYVTRTEAAILSWSGCFVLKLSDNFSRPTTIASSCNIHEINLNTLSAFSLILKPLAQLDFTIMASVGTWHRHVYNNPPKQPTPHFVANILGLKSAHQPNRATSCVRDFDQPLSDTLSANSVENEEKKPEQSAESNDSNRRKISEKEIQRQSKSDTKGRGLIWCVNGFGNWWRGKSSQINF